jgi:protein SCO1/2
MSRTETQISQRASAPRQTSETTRGQCGRQRIDSAATTAIARNLAIVIAALAMLASATARAQTQDYFPGSHMPGGPSNFHPSILKDVGIDQNLGVKIPADLVFKDETGKTVRLSDYLGKRPLVLAPVYYGCPMLCTLALNDLLRSLKTLPIAAGTDFDVIAVSFNPREGPDLAAQKKATYIKEYNRPGTESGWHFLTGTQESSKPLMDAIGFHYAWDESSQQYAHASCMIILTPDGTTSRYLYGVDYAPEDLRNGIETASGGQLSPPSQDVVLLYCFHYDPSTGRFGIIITRALRVGGTLTLAALGTFVLLTVRRDRQIQMKLNANAPNVDLKTEKGG